MEIPFSHQRYRSRVIVSVERTQLPVTLGAWDGAWESHLPYLHNRYPEWQFTEMKRLGTK